jgi:hypothetical protein
MTLLGWGQAIALGVAYYLKTGFWKIALCAFLGWAYVAYEAAKIIFKSVGA